MSVLPDASWLKLWALGRRYGAMSHEHDELTNADIAVDLADARAYELARMRHSAAHLMAEAVQEMFPDARFGIGPAIQEGCILGP